MSHPVISIEGLGKQYRIGTQSRATNFREAATNALTSPWRRLRKLGGSKFDETESFWALRDVNIEIHRGDVVGIVGRNGAGKSTMLKVLSRITEPTVGQVKMRGRVASLLEVGTGFHPELTGRENIYLNAAILGMKKTEIDRKFDAIVAFAEVEKFLDTPVKHYSSGMYVRLAFAVAAHLEPEILVVDEVLAVGDAAFQKKCMGKMGDVAKQGRTILFVSHNMAAVRALCSRAVWLKGGQVLMDDATGPVVDAYLKSVISATGSHVDLTDQPREGSNGSQLRITSVSLNHGKPVEHGQPFTARLNFEVTSDVEEVSLGVGMATLEGVRIVTIDTDLQNPERPSFKAGYKGSVEVRVDRLDLQPGNYMIDVGARSGDRFCLDYLGGCVRVEVIPGPTTATSIMRSDGGVRMPGSWSWAGHTQTALA
ncbi:MAG: ATP-binding cassette domain-containing protein [Phycisphaera sp.]|nr:ATP-binding cassette domain-containing protein [Phycisphaera sp.]